MVIFFQSEKKTTAQTHGNMAENSAKKIPIQRLIWLSNEREKERQKENWKKLATSSSSSAASLFKNFLKKNEQKIFFLETDKQTEKRKLFSPKSMEKKENDEDDRWIPAPFQCQNKTKQVKHLIIINNGTKYCYNQKKSFTYLLWKKRKTIKETKKYVKKKKRKEKWKI